jgi:adenylosuccinate synthase
VPNLRISLGKGVGPCYSAKASRSGIFLANIFDSALLETRLRRMADGYRKQYGDLFKYDVEEELERFRTIYLQRLADMVIDEVPLLRSAKQNHWPVIVEGAQATMLCNTFGTYPQVTSSNCSVGGLIAGLSLGWQSIKEVVCMVASLKGSWH